jgi:hypothetical protein
VQLQQAVALRSVKAVGVKIVSVHLRWRSHDGVVEQVACVGGRWLEVCGVVLIAIYDVQSWIRYDTIL